MKTILVSTDFSKCAQNAIAYAHELALRSGAELVLLNVLYPTEGVENNVYESIWINDYIRQREKDLNALGSRLAKDSAFAKTPLRTVVRVGFPVPEICEAASEYDADLIVVGGTGATGLRGVILGSTAAGVAARSSRPVFIIPSKGKFKKADNFVLATDFVFKADQRSIEVLKSVLDIHGAKLKIVHILSGEKSMPDKSREAGLSEKLWGIAHDFHYLHSDDVPTAVNHYLESVDGHGLITVSHEYDLLHRLLKRSVTKYLAYHAFSPMLVLHDHKK